MIFKTKPELETESQVAPELSPNARHLIELETEITQLQNEAVQLAQLQTELSPELANNQAALIAGDADAVATAAGTSARLNAVTARRAELATQLQALEEQAAPLRLEIARVANYARLRGELCALAIASTATLSELEAERARVDTFLSEAAPKLSEARGALSGQRAPFLGIVSQLAPGVGVPNDPYSPRPNVHTAEYAEGQNKLNELLELFAQLENEGARLDAVRSDFQTGHSMRTFDRQAAFAPRKHAKALSVLEGLA